MEKFKPNLYVLLFVLLFFSYTSIAQGLNYFNSNPQGFNFSFGMKLHFPKLVKMHSSKFDPNKYNSLGSFGSQFESPPILNISQFQYQPIIQTNSEMFKTELTKFLIQLGSDFILENQSNTPLK